MPTARRILIFSVAPTNWASSGPSATGSGEMDKGAPRRQASSSEATIPTTIPAVRITTSSSRTDAGHVELVDGVLRRTDAGHTRDEHDNAAHDDECWLDAIKEVDALSRCLGYARSDQSDESRPGKLLEEGGHAPVL